MPGFQLNPQQISDFKKNGYLIVENFLNPAEVTKFSGIALADNVMQKKCD